MALLFSLSIFFNYLYGKRERWRPKRSERQTTGGSSRACVLCSVNVGTRAARAVRSPPRKDTGLLPPPRGPRPSRYVTLASGDVVLSLFDRFAPSMLWLCIGRCISFPFLLLTYSYETSVLSVSAVERGTKDKEAVSFINNYFYTLTKIKQLIHVREEWRNENIVSLVWILETTYYRQLIRGGL